MEPGWRKSRNTGAGMIRLLMALTVGMMISPCAEACDDNQARSAIRRLAQQSPAGYALYQKTQKYPSARSMFMQQLKNGAGGSCDLETAAHEGAHVLAGPENLNRYPLISGGSVPRVADEQVFFPPKELYSKFANFPESNYLKNEKDGPSSINEFGYLLDEFNSYTWDAQVSLDLGNGLQVNGMLQFMQFVAAYIERGYQTKPATFNRLMTNPSRATVAALWAQAHDVLAKACLQPRFTSPFLKGACSASQNLSLSQIVGEKAQCPASCRAPTGESRRSVSPPPSIIEFARPNRPASAAPAGSGSFILGTPEAAR